MWQIWLTLEFFTAGYGVEMAKFDLPTVESSSRIFAISSLGKLRLSSGLLQIIHQDEPRSKNGQQLPK